jgi:hypothetical protein
LSSLDLSFLVSLVARITVRLMPLMDPNSTLILCDGCGLPASPAHLAARLERLELATRFRPIHIHLLFVALQPAPRLEDDFYRPPESRDFFDPFLSALAISPEEAKQSGESNDREAGISRLLEFQRRGYYLTYLSECPVTTRHSANQDVEGSAARECISRLAPTFVKRVRFNYKPKHIALLGTNLSPLIEVFEHAGIRPLLLLDRGAPLSIPSTGDAPSLSLFRRAVKIDAPCGTSSSASSGV